MRKMKQTESDVSWSDAYRFKWDGLPRCTGCGRVMRPVQTSPKEWPGTVAKVTSTGCATCYKNGVVKGGEHVLSADQIAARRERADLARLRAEEARLRRRAEKERKAEEKVSGVKTGRAAVATTWTETEHAVVWAICARYDAESSLELIQTLGLFRTDRNNMYSV